MVQMVLTMALCCILLTWGAQHASAAACDHTYPSGSEPEANYGAAWNTQSSSQELLIEGTECGNGTASVQYGTNTNEQYIYKSSYYWDGTKWNEHALASANLLADTWHRGSAVGSFPLLSNGSTFTVAYICQYIDQNWKCGCKDSACTESYWQLQGVKESETNYSGAVLEEPPVMDPNNTVVFENVCPEDAGFPTRSQMAGKDVKITLPKDRVCKTRASIGGTTSVAANNIWVVGGKIEYYSSDINGGGGITLAYWKGTAFFEGLEIDMQNSCNDGIRSYTAMGENARVVIQNSYIRGLGYCTPSGTHGDMYHAQGGLPVVKEFVMQNSRGDLINQGIFVPYRESGHGVRKMILDHVELRLDDRYKFVLDKISTMIYAGTYNNNEDLPPPDGQSYNEVYLNWWDPWYPNTIDRKNITIPNVDGYDANGCGIFSEQTKTDFKILSGQWCKGSPPNGTFVPLDKIGLNYDRSYFVTE